MKYYGNAAVALCLGAWCSGTLISSAQAAGASPAVLVSSRNQPQACVTPGRLMAFARARNPGLRSRFDKIAVDYMRHGEALNIRWDYAFFQMMLETGTLKFNGDVNWRQNNFAGLGATGGGVKGERFASVSDGVRAHLEHLLIYAGVHVDNPVADRTRKVQSWNILAKWQRSIRGPMTFGHIGQKWAPGARRYTHDIGAISDAFHASHCNRVDPRPDLLAEARGRRGSARVAETARVRTQPIQNVLSKRASLGASTVYRRPSASVAAQQRTVAKTPARSPNFASNVKILNSTQSPKAKPTKETSVWAPEKTAERSSGKKIAAGQPRKPVAGQKVASAGQLAAKFATPWLNPATRQQKKAAPSATVKSAAPKVAPTKCRVWTASYGGRKAIIIKSADTSHVNYTVLDVNPKRERQEADAYIAAYAKGGQKIGEFGSQTLALDKAFKLCPDG